tara:strand:- start:239 stop:1927 length:1689 start_codon:yes stop_codon:yes gene_type:complete
MLRLKLSEGKKKGRPKLKKGEKGRYQVSAKQKARRAILAQKRHRDKQIKKHSAELKRQKQLKTKNINDLKTLDKGLQGKGAITEDVLADAPTAVKELVADREVAFNPNQGPQTEFLAAPERDVLYGGAAGGGKSYALLADALRYAHNPNHRGLLLRRTLGELTELIDKSRQLYMKAFPEAVFKESKSTWIFPSGATILFSYLDRDTDVTRYQGQSFNWIAIDEITHYPTPYVWEYLRSRLRTTDQSIIPYMRCTANPGGVGGWWIKKMYIDPTKSNTPFWARDVETNRILRYGSSNAEKAGKPLFQRRFIPARLTDNPYLMASGEYEAMLNSLPEVERRRLLEGDWDVTDGAAFAEFDRGRHVVEPFEIPRSWSRIRAADYGYSSPSCVLWGAIDFDGNLWIYRELYGKGFTGEQLAERILELEYDDPTIQTAVLDESCFSRTGHGLSIAESMNRLNLRFMASNRDRLAGKIEMHKRLGDNDLDEPRLRIFNNCKHLIRTLPTLPLSKTNPEDVDTKADDHAYDALRYMCMTRLVNSPYYHPRFRKPREYDRYVPNDPIFGY